jgi:hypothetical protein
MKHLNETIFHSFLNACLHLDSKYLHLRSSLILNLRQLFSLVRNYCLLIFLGISRKKFQAVFIESESSLFILLFPVKLSKVIFILSQYF